MRSWTRDMHLRHDAHCHLVDKTVIQWEGTFEALSWHLTETKKQLSQNRGETNTHGDARIKLQHNIYIKLFSLLWEVTLICITLSEVKVSRLTCTRCYLEMEELACDWLEAVVAALSWEKPLWQDSRLVMDPLQNIRKSQQLNREGILININTEGGVTLIQVHSIKKLTWSRGRPAPQCST